MGRLLGWNRRKRATETRRYLDLVESEQAVIGMDTGPGARGGAGREREMNPEGVGGC